MTQNNNSSYLKQLTILFYALVGGLLLFSAFAYFVIPNTTDIEGDDSLYEIFRYLIPGMAIVSIFSSRLTAGKLIEQAKKQTELSTKLATYRTACIIRWSMLEGVGLFAVIAFVLTQNQVMILVALAVAGYLFTQRPTLDLVTSELNLGREEQQVLVQ